MRAQGPPCAVCGNRVSKAVTRCPWCHRVLCLRCECPNQCWKTQILTDELNQPLRWFYLSFAVDDRFYGAAIVEAPGEAHAIQRTHQLGINPGGEVAIFAVPDGAPLPEAAKNRLLSKSDIETIWPARSILK